MQSLRSYWHALKAKMVKDPLPPEDVAAGWALGMFVGCAVPFGLQLIVSVPLALMMRVSKIGATLGTLITNPVTIFIIYPAQTWAVYRVLFGGSPELPSEWTWETVKALAGRTVASFFLGGVLLGVLLTPLTFFAVRRLVVASRAAADRRRAAKRGA